VLDATTLEAWARGRKRRESHDPDANWAIKNPDGSTKIEERPAKQISKKAKTGKRADTRGKRTHLLMRFRYEVHTFTWIPEEGSAKGTVPNLTERISITAGGSKDALADLMPIARGLVTADRPIADVVVDRWYSRRTRPTSPTRYVSWAVTSSST
jgi:hypothetical protein